MRQRTDEELAALLETNQVDRSILNMVAERLRRIGVEQLLTSIQVVEAINSSPLVDRRVAETIEPLVLAPQLRKQSSARMSSLAGRILAGADYTHGDVLSLAASVMSQDETSQSS
jgi:hypothetical protein